MTDLTIELPDGNRLTFVQALSLARLIKQSENEGKKAHWHMNDCKCCLTLHCQTHCYVIGEDGGYTFFPGAGCDCEEVER